MFRCVCLLILLLFVSLVESQSAPDLDALAKRIPAVTLDPVFHCYQLSPCQYYGFTFDDNYEEMKQMNDLGAVSVMTNRIWIPVQDESAPGGDGFQIAQAHSGSNDLGKLTLYDTLDKLGMSCAVSVGDWNNGLFPYYPDWFYAKYPDFGMVDQHGQPFEATMFDKPRRWPSIEHPQQIQGCRRFIEQYCSLHRNERTIPMWVLGGEEFYPTYLWSDRWADYSDLAVTHFREWCKYTYSDIEALNRAWKTTYNAYSEVAPPTKPDPSDPRSADWFRFRLRAMAERFVWMYQAVRYGDVSRLALSCNHGDIYNGLAATQMGAMPDIYAGVCDGFETGQIIVGDDPNYFNLMYAESLGSLGKPVAPTRLAYKFLDPKARGGARSYTPDAVWRYSYETLGMGGWLLGILQWRGSLPDGEWGIKDTPAVKESSTIFNILKHHSDDLLHMYPVKPKLAVYLPRDQWLFKYWQSSWTLLHIQLIQNHIPKAYVYDDSELSDYETILIVDSQVSSPQALAKLKQFLARGKTIICLNTGTSGSKPDHANLLSLLGKNVVVSQGAESGYKTCTYTANSSGLVLATVTDGSINSFIRDYLQKLAPIKVHSDKNVEHSRTIMLNTTQQDTPLDLHGTGGLRQTVIAPNGRLTAISFCTPTYMKKVDSFSLRASVSNENGDVVGGIAIPPDELSDNSWHNVPVNDQVTPGERLTLEFAEPENLPSQTLGVWATRSDSYPSGSLSDSRGGISGDVICQARTALTVPTTQLIEAFTLSDSLNTMNVFVNLSDQDSRIKVGIGRELLTDGGAKYDVIDTTTDSRLGAVDRNNPTYEMTIPAHRATAVLVLRQTSENEAEDAVAELDKRPSDVRSYADEYNRSASYVMGKGNYAKTLAMAVRAKSALHITGSAQITKGILRIETSSASALSKDAIISARITPAFGYTCVLHPAGSQKYAADIDLGSLPKMYDYGNKKYVEMIGPLVIDINAIDGHRTGALRVIARQDTGTK